MPLQTAYFTSPLGSVRIVGDESGIHAISCLDEPTPISSDPDLAAPIQACLQQLTDYFAGTRRSFDLPLTPAGTAFQQTVWQALLEVPYGKTLSYLTLARRLGDEKAIRAVAAANGRNPLWIVVPCHRIIGSNGSLTGYAGGLWRKKWLLEHERGEQQLSLNLGF
ncbi:methylated-DNA--[protein]-cysteine S-methyltransferase [Tellurirhabdus bombi]|uniref:methylated-DNA--[protein]-cysteine S-methyltransferase n=1 Tax=Tellurirhabdus bombi TaxID=2907205 RepID=UPI001F1EC1E3|nr:methylated-DNA--[protein]-cysteine S-methyltransferase [Tellurirhabdus bombi]